MTYEPDPAAAGRLLLVLGGGGALGSFQAGGVLALAEAGLLPDALHGCSAGALNAAFLAVDPTVARAGALVDWWCDPASHAVLAPSGWTRLRSTALALTGRRGSLLDDRALRALVARHIPTHDLSELAVPVTATTTCLDCLQPRHHGAGPVADLLAASCALPGLLPPVRLGDGHDHVDGGVLCGVPLQAALDHAGPDDRVVVLDCGLAPVTGLPGRCAAAGPGACGLDVDEDVASYVAPVERSRGALDVVLRAFTAARDAANRAAVGEALADPRVHVAPHVADAWAAGVLRRLPRGPRDVALSAELAEAGRRATSAWLSSGALTALAPR